MTEKNLQRSRNIARNYRRDIGRKQRLLISAYYLIEQLSPNAEILHLIRKEFTTCGQN